MDWRLGDEATVGYHQVVVPLADRACLPCTAATPGLGEPEIGMLLGQVEGWKIDDQGHLRKSYGFKNFAEAVAFVNTIAPVAEEAGHHPDLTVRWGEVGVELWTHAIDGLSENDFVLAARIDRIAGRR